MGGALGNVSSSVAQVTKGLSVSPIIQQALGDIAKSGDQRAAFNAILLATTASVAKKPNFNLELEINDLFTRLGNLRGAAPSGGAFAGIGQQVQQITSQLTQMLGNVESAVQALAKNVK